MRANYTHSFFCGHLSVDGTKIDELLTTGEWFNTMVTSEEHQQYCNIFYEGFADSILPVKGRISNDKYRQLTHLVMPIGKSVTIATAADSCSFVFEVMNIHLFRFPFDVVLFSIEIQTDEVNLDDLTFAHFKLRNINSYHCDKAIGESGFLEIIKPLLDLCGTNSSGGVNYANLEHTGNKLKLFQVIHCDELSDNTLYEVGTLSPIGSVANHNNINSPSVEYFEMAIQKHKISVFRNWSAIMLFDTATILRLAPKPNPSQFDQWSSSYFRIVYLHCLYQKTLLFGVNQQFRASSVNRSKISSLVETMKEQEYYYAFSNISYNFLPQIIYDKTLQALDVASERKELKYYLDQEESKQRDAANDTLNVVLTFIAILSVFSTLYDATSLIKDTFDMGTGSLMHQTVVFGIGGFIVLLIAVFLLLKLRRKNEKRG